MTKFYKFIYLPKFFKSKLIAYKIALPEKPLHAFNLRI